MPAAHPIRESKVKRGCRRWAEKYGWRAHGWNRPGRKGANDDFYTKKPGRIKFVEYKQDGREPDPLQVAEIKKLTEEGFEVHVVDCIEAGPIIFND